MRLIDVRDGSFKEFIGSQIPEYAILSHTWEDGEVTYKDVIENRHKTMKGFEKIEMTCRIAASQGIAWAWVDTCCIDKSSSAELTEAINSMFRWYQRSKICYAYLNDLPSSAGLEEALPKCRWFTRGWTLQELIAPSELIFFDQQWTARGDKLEFAIVLQKITRIRLGILLGTNVLGGIAVAEKMSWAAHRQTTRIEDSAYCLLGIFDVNLPLLYGEEEKAFRRLQEEIIRTTYDRSIFAWQLPPSSKYNGRVLCGVLATSPAAFCLSGQLTWEADTSISEFTSTNQGIRSQVHWLGLPGTSFSYGHLTGCQRKATGKELVVRLRKVGPGRFLREDPWSLFEVEPDTLHYAFNPHRRQDHTYLRADIKALFTEDSYAKSALAQDQVPTVHISVLGKTRRHILALQCPYHLFRQFWPESRYDREDALFFTTSDYHEDFASAYLSYTMPEGSGGEMSGKSFHFMFYAIGWSGKSKDLQCTIVEYTLYKKHIKSLEERLAYSNFDSRRALDNLKVGQIPKTSELRIKFPGDDRTVLTSLKTRLRYDDKICRREVWTVEFCMEIADDRDLPPQPEVEWFS